MAEPQSLQELQQQLRRLRQQGQLDAARGLITQAAQAGLLPPAQHKQWALAHDARWWAAPAGRRCRLVRRNPAHLSFVRHIWADPHFIERFNPGAPPLPEADSALLAILANEYATLLDNGASFHWTIETLQGEPFGMLSLTGISLSHRRAELLIGVLNAPYTGAATEATLLAADFAFKVMQLTKLTALVPTDNAPSLAGSQHIGFVREGLLARHILHPRTRQPIDLVALALFADDPHAEQAQARVRRRLLAAIA